MGFIDSSISHMVAFTLNTLSPVSRPAAAIRIPSKLYTITATGPWGILEKKSAAKLPTLPNLCHLESLLLFNFSISFQVDLFSH